MLNIEADKKATDLRVTDRIPPLSYLQYQPLPLNRAAMSLASPPTCTPSLTEKIAFISVFISIGLFFFAFYRSHNTPRHNIHTPPPGDPVDIKSKQLSKFLDVGIPFLQDVVRKLDADAAVPQETRDLLETIPWTVIA